ncbi:allantoinase AllB [Gracilibacillus oryzae]|uniref:Allantoinase AllB n=1 Tax=Gracilibacillus oryzae TaxID=1672701 RepID=A0A7C8GVB6_9BACI|nr:allantoinase AllB [Gracilibacillus oryzae]KAB8138225.1 allantoinase AllB [Gracilibacillus oryzae]
MDKHAADLLLINGNAVLPDGVKQVNIAIKDGKILSINEEQDRSAKEIIDIQGNYIFPGAIDVHVHFNEPGQADWEGFETGSYMLAAGGYTTFFDMPLNSVPSTTTSEAYLLKDRLARQKSCLDYYLWGGLVPGNIADLSELADLGAIGFKAFLSDSGNEDFEAVDDSTLLQGMQEIARLNKILALHAESNTITNFLKEKKLANQQFDLDDYLASRPIIAETEAVQRAIYYAEITGCPLHFVHISSWEAIKVINEAKNRGLNITVETCPHYLLFNHEDIKVKGNLAKCAPPIRRKKENEKLIELLIEDQFDIIASDHSPAPFTLKDPNTHNIFSAWGGISGGQFSLLAMIELAKLYSIPFEKIAKWTAKNPANRFSIQKKGIITEGYDADLSIISMNEETIVTPENYFARHKQSIYMDHHFPCRVKKTFLRGRVVYDSQNTQIQIQK